MTAPEPPPPHRGRWPPPEAIEAVARAIAGTVPTVHWLHRMGHARAAIAALEPWITSAKSEASQP